MRPSYKKIETTKHKYTMLSTVKYQVATYSGVIQVNSTPNESSDSVEARAKQMLIQRTGSLPYGFERFTEVNREEI